MKHLPELDHPLFYVDECQPADFFQMEYDYYISQSLNQPWKKGEMALKGIKQRWEENIGKIEMFFQRKDNAGVNKVMVASIALFMQYLFWSNEQPVNMDRLEERVSHLPVQAINTMERLTFVMNRPTLHHSFAQLKALFVEQEKAYYKYVTIQKRS
ncbi:YpoC family protein [Fervidibacillus albus]|uniref:YpoC-like domain-containing protein n=1 Tax=Fervidibacillus albus TaxID=2980026 RepID=A0A9E8LVQ9_9BACI|nr:hypothetical protein [Fervidibacillus albus]WAA10588.1 hypothetical protein OE104_04515 [Fervidibacillus albus]